MQEADRQFFFCVNTLLERPVGPDNNFTMNIQKPVEVTDVIRKVTEEDLNYKQACLRAFSVTKRGEAKQKNTFPKLQEITVTVRPG
jgi:hypothetical protein